MESSLNLEEANVNIFSRLNSMEKHPHVYKEDSIGRLSQLECHLLYFCTGNTTIMCCDPFLLN